MKVDIGASEASQRYAAAHTAHHEAHDLGEALDLYVAITAEHAGSPEAAYSRSQIQNIIKAVVPEQALFDLQVGLAREHIERGK